MPEEVIDMLRQIQELSGVLIEVLSGEGGAPAEGAPPEGAPAEGAPPEGA